MLENYVDSKTAAKKIGVTITHLHVWLLRHPEFKPRQSYGKSYLWTEEEITKVIDKRAKEDLPADSE